MAKKIESLINAGTLAPDNLMNKIIKEKLSSGESQHGYILDGYPRNITQAKFLSQVNKLTHMIKVNITDDEAIRRNLGRRTCDKCQTVYHLKYNPPKRPDICDKCGGKLIIREDESEKVLQIRLSNYHRFTEPMLEYFKKQGILIDIDGAQSIEKVHQDILKALKIGG